MQVPLLLVYARGGVKKQSTPAPVPVDKTALDAALVDASEYAESEHSTGSWAPFQSARDAADTVNNDPEATQQQVDDAYNALIIAQSNLVYIASLANAVSAAAALVEEDYTPESWTVFASALTNAQGVLADADTTQTAVSDALTALNTAQNDLITV